MIEELLYTDKESNYFLLDYAPGHSEMVIRSIKTGGQNIDRFFKNVKYINLPVKFTGIHIFKTARPASMPAKNLYDNVHVLKIMDDSGLQGYIEARLLVVFQNSLGVTVSCLGDFTWTNDNKELLAWQID